MALTELQDLDPATQKIAIEATGLREQNVKLVGQIEQLGGDIDLQTARMEHLMMSLVDLKVISERQLWEISRDWESALRPQLKASLERMQAAYRERIAAQQRAQVNAPPEKKLIVPGRRG